MVRMVSASTPQAGATASGPRSSSVARAAAAVQSCPPGRRLFPGARHFRQYVQPRADVLESHVKQQHVVDKMTAAAMQMLQAYNVLANDGVFPKIFARESRHGTSGWV